MNNHVPPSKRVHIFHNGRSRAIRIPKEFDFDSDEVDVTRQPDGSLIVTPVVRPQFASWSALFASMEPLGPEDEFPDANDSDLLPLDDVDL